MRIRQVNRTARPVFGDTSDVIGRDFEEVARVLWAPQLAEDIVARFRHTLDTGISYVVPEYIDERLDRHRTEHYQWEIHRIELRDGRMGIVCYFMDISVYVRAKNEKAQSEERLRFSLEAGRIGSWDLDLLTRTAWRSIGHDHIFGYKELLPEWTYEMFLSHVLPEERRVVDDAFQAALGGTDIWDVECRIQTADGQLRWIAPRGRVSRDDEGKPARMHGTIEDITQRKSDEQELAHSRQLFEQISATSPDILFIYDIDEGRNVFASARVKEVLGYTSEEFQRLPVEFKGGLAHSDDLTHIAAWLSGFQACMAGEVREIEHRARHADGTYRTLRVRASVFRRGEDQHVQQVIGTAQDVTEEKNAARELKKSEQRFHLLANTIPLLAWMAHADGHIFWYNERWYEYTGTTPESQEGWGWQSVHEQQELPRIVAKWQTSLAAGEPWEDIFALRRHDGEFRAHLSRAAPLRDEHGQIVLWFGTNTDIEDERRTAEERNQLLESERAARAQIERAGQLKDEFLATLSHELRTPLSAILGWSHILRLKSRGDAELAEGISVIERNARAQAQLIDDLLDMSRIISGKLRLDVQQVNLPQVIDDAVKSVRPALEAKDIRLETVLDPHGGPLRGDPARLQQVVWNLLSNAIKFTPKGGKVQLGLQRVNSHVEITVTDTGSGITPEFLPYVFERFRQSDGSITRRHGGLGLGLSIVKSLVELHGGSVRAKSPGQGRGATFVVELPLMVVHGDETNGVRTHPHHSTAELSSESICAADALEGVSVLVVDDDADARRLITRVLEDCNAEVMVAASAAEAMDVLPRLRPAVLLSDIGMPEEDGYAFIRRVRALREDQGSRTPAAALTAFARWEDRMRALRAGYQSHIAKPVEPAELVTIVAVLAGKMGSGIALNARVPTIVKREQDPMDGS